jgi:hypothetical protein
MPTGRKGRIPAPCHPERPYHCLGLCRRCYYHKYRREYNIAYHKADYPRKRAYFRKRNYGITQEEFLALLSKQNNSCAICKIAFGDSTPQVDHNHKTNKVRGLLCSPCNCGLGNFKEQVDYLQAATTYLNEYEQ